MPLQTVIRTMNEFVVMIREAIHTTYCLLFYDPARSFRALAVSKNDGTWQHSYSAHRESKKRVRALSVTSLLVVALATVISNYILSFVL